MGKSTAINKNDGFNIMVNLYIIRRIYRVLGKNKASTFKGVDYYKDVMEISRPRYGRICNGEQFQLPAEERKELCEMFNIDETYFKADGKIIEIHQVTENDWKCLLNYNYFVDYDVSLPRNKIEETAKRVDELISQSVKKKLIESTYSESDALFRIYYYFKKGTAYRTESQLTKFTRELGNMKISDWNEILQNKTQLQHYGELLDKHSRYIQAVLTCIECNE